MADSNNNTPGLGHLVSRVVRTGVGALRNRAELLAVEWQVEKVRLMELLAWIIGAVFLAFTGLVLLTATVIFLLPPRYRLVAAGVFGLLYLAGALGAWFGLKKHLKQQPFEESLAQARKDATWLESFQ